MTEKLSIPAGHYVVAENESIPTVALRSGHFWQTLWAHPKNAELAALRKDPNILMPRDVVFVPPLRRRVETVRTGRRHVFRRRGVPSRFSLRMFERNQPRANEPFRLLLDDGRTIAGALDADGTLNVFLDATVTHATLFVGEGDAEACYEIDIGALRPVDAIEGVQQRLRNLGFYGGEIDGAASNELSDAVAAFQASAGLPVTRQSDDATRNALVSAHDQR